MSDPVKRGRSARNKGAEGERELARYFQEHGFDTHRGYVFYKQSDVVGLPGIHIECKRVEKLNVSAALKQSINESITKADGIPTLFHRRNREDWLVTMRLDDWIELYKSWNDRTR